MEDSFAAGLVGIVLDGRYRLDALLGEGGMGAVFRAHHLAMDRRVAIKLLKPHLTTDQAALHRFAREARSTLKVDSPHAVKVLDFGITPHQDYYMVLEYLDGRTVQRELDVDGTFSPARTLHIAKHALLALGAAHKMGLIHRDIKPDNILLMRVGDDPDYTKVLDFGVAKLMDGAAQSSKSALAITQAGMVFGTPEFMSPEQSCGQSLDPRSDLYSLAATMFAMLTGCGMYQAKTPIDWLTSHARVPAPHLVDGKPELEAFGELDRVLQICFSKRREQRPADADAMIRLLEGVERTLAGGAPHDPRGVATAPARAMRGPAVSPQAPAMRGVAASPSSFIAALPHDTLTDPDATILPGAVHASAHSLASIPKQPSAANAPTIFAATGEAPATTTGAVAAVRGRRGLWLALGGVAILAMVVTAIVVASRKHGGRSEPPPIAAKHADAGSAINIGAPGDGPTAVAIGSDRRGPPIDAGARPDAPVAVAAGSDRHAPPIDPAGSGSHPVSKINIDVARYIAAAEDAQRHGKRITEISQAQAALQLDPHNVRAKLLLADGLISDGDLDRGCKYLRELGRNAIAVMRAHQAGCPTN